MPSSAGPPVQNTGPPGHDLNIESTLRQLNTNMGTMTQLLNEVCARLPTGNIDASSSSRSPPGAGQERRRRRSVSISSDEPSEHENESKMLHEDDETQPRGCRMTATRQHLARLLNYYPRQPSAPGLIKSRFFSPTTNLLTVLTYLHFEIPYMYTRGASSLRGQKWRG